MKMIEFPRTFPLRTFVVCFTIWLIATEVLVFDEIKFNARIELLEQAGRTLRAPEVIVPSERSSDLPKGHEDANIVNVKNRIRPVMTSNVLPLIYLTPGTLSQRVEKLPSDSHPAEGAMIGLEVGP
jgi:hypothetical protein